jgi:hypothetical protein
MGYTTLYFPLDFYIWKRNKAESNFQNFSRCMNHEPAYIRSSEECLTTELQKFSIKLMNLYYPRYKKV